jgi:hypothetical protein
MTVPHKDAEYMKKQNGDTVGVIETPDEKPPTDEEMEKAGIKIETGTDGEKVYRLPDKEEDIEDPVTGIKSSIESSITQGKEMIKQGKEKAMEYYELGKKKAMEYYNKFKKLYQNPKAQAVVGEVVTNKKVGEDAFEMGAQTASKVFNALPVVGEIGSITTAAATVAEKGAKLIGDTESIVQKIDHEMPEAEDKKGGTRRRHTSLRQRRRRTRRGPR